MRYLIAVLILALEALVQASIFSRFTLLGAAPQLVLLSAIAWSLVRGPAEGMFWGFVGGLSYDLVSGGPIGVSAVAMVVAAALAGLGGRALFGSNVLFPLGMVFLTTGVYVAVSAFLLATLHYRTDWNLIASSVLLPTAAANAALGLVIYPLFAFVNEHTDHRARVQI
ncbi:MAG: rod shape-determining protein MreD [Chloroflexota bacterium]|nr:rod shape-determining protein MreD [Chloroflexota bacterium]